MEQRFSVFPVAKERFIILVSPMITLKQKPCLVVYLSQRSQNCPKKPQKLWWVITTVSRSLYNQVRPINHVLFHSSLPKKQQFILQKMYAWKTTVSPQGSLYYQPKLHALWRKFHKIIIPKCIKFDSPHKW